MLEEIVKLLISNVLILSILGELLVKQGLEKGLFLLVFRVINFLKGNIPFSHTFHIREPGFNGQIMIVLTVELNKCWNHWEVERSWWISQATGFIFFKIIHQFGQFIVHELRVNETHKILFLGFKKVVQVQLNRQLFEACYIISKELLESLFVLKWFDFLGLISSLPENEYFS